MQHHRAMLHSPVDFTAEDLDHIETALADRRKAKLARRRSNKSDGIEIPLTTISKADNFDAYLSVYLSDKITSVSALFDSGNANLIYPYMEHIEALPNWQSRYRVLATDVTEPWQCKANIVQGPILLQTADGTFLETTMTFYACTADNPDKARTSNFGAGCVSPWSANGWNTPVAGITLRSPLAYSTYECVEINYAAQASVISNSASVKISDESYLTLTNSPNAAYNFLKIIEHFEWMSVHVVWLSIDSNVGTGWPGPYTACAFIDTGGGPANLSDPHGYLYNRTWPDPAPIPGWAGKPSKSCIATSAPIGIQLQDPDGKQFGYYINTTNQPTPAQGLTLVMCQSDHYMMEQYGMNIGGVSALSVSICVNYASATVGFYHLRQSS